MSAPIRVVVLDLGGVVVQICRTWQEGCRAAGVEHRSHAEQHVHSPQTARLIDQHQRGKIECQDFHRDLSSVLQGTYSAGELQSIHTAWTRDEYPGVAQVLDRIHAAGMDTACLSNTNASHWQQLHAGEAFRKIRKRFASHELGLAKPDPEIFRAFERATGYAAHEIIFFDDLDENVAAARRCGWRAVCVDHSGDTAAQILSALAQQGVQV